MTIGTPVECFVAEHTTLTAATSVETLTVGMAVGTRGFVLVGSTAAKIVSSIVDSKGNTWTVDKTQAGAVQAVSICSAPITVALVPTDTVTITWSSATSSTTDVSIQNVSGLYTFPVDSSPGATGAATPAATGASSTLTQPREIVWAICNFGTTAATAPAGFTGVTTTPLPGNFTTVVYQIVSALTAINAQFVAGTGAWAAAEVTYRGAADPITSKGGGAQAASPIQVSGDQACKTTSGRLSAIALNPNGAVTPTVTVFDNASAASGTVLFGPFKMASGVPLFMAFADEGINAANGIFISSTSWASLTATAYVK
jgi:hypothetical protein